MSAHDWSSKLFVLVLLGFAATDFVITMTLSAADAAEHLVENPLVARYLHGGQLVATLVLLADFHHERVSGARRASAPVPSPSSPASK